MFFSFRKEKAWYVGLGNTERVLLHNFQCLDTQESFVSRLRPFLRSRMGEEIILIEHSLNARIMVLLVLSSFIVHRVIPVIFVTFLSILHMRFHGYIIASQWQNQDCARWASFQVSPPPDCGS